MAGGSRVCGNLFPRPILKGELLFTRGFYYYLMVSNLVLRLAWLHKLVPSLRHSHAAIMLFALLEVRRAPQLSSGSAASSSASSTNLYYCYYFI